MSFVIQEPPESSENINISPSHPLHELLILLGGMFAIILAVWWLLGLAVDWVVPKIDARNETRLAGLYASVLAQTEEGDGSLRLQKYLADLNALQFPDPKLRPDYQAHLLADSTINALALPGGHILILSGFLKQAESENELIFVLGHELGHLVHRDHLRAMGRSLVMYSLATMLLGPDNFISGFAENSLKTLELKFSREQELEADRLGLELLVKTYGHAGGSQDFFRRLESQQENSKFLSYLSTHPHPRERIERLKAMIRERHFLLKPVKPLPKQFQDLTKKELKATKTE
ncbi:peptidase M48 [bacterium (Candidatus Blackallbacteria) CG17_big_fil_post_rev_8_21_14_2_50_48_46]|uniref:Peptidase M48 n=1 Tax=bacterium (Candidatus Blackallbacteria) CG17_big_fil_post_rev_8_21_14_2_50_48_46 TaxID=2014261 RepID=A0A2M7G861_9BACT|nr:MAG: peptidase M48 [bacterium (Candidatus Blackallbacteria) CG18_big_fil_WC_8_21_14_2_50_49_26]PIW18275.1 MAG: peptidase M48 [bacterium (Candidatus Blackallbacteria) CG17_big_fil_post_rev_8_21_14_2_50_48_46]PIW49499.1 MAG: peptidase M48 [bacterium (Candidatus Blackallbacteria) CG13_big_fil_rev_8_21_14_2_50_49_14]